MLPAVFPCQGVTAHLSTHRQRHTETNPQPAQHRSRLFPKGSKASPKIGGPQAGQSTLIFSYKEKVFQGTFSEQEPPPEQEGSCCGVQRAPSCSELSPGTGAQLVPASVPSTAGLSVLRASALHEPGVHLAGAEGFLTKGGSELALHSPSGRPCSGAVLLSLLPSSCDPGQVPWQVKDIPSARGF